MKNKPVYCLFCGMKAPRYSYINGIQCEGACVNPDCPHYGTESINEYESLEGFSIINLDEVDDADDF